MPWSGWVKNENGSESKVKVEPQPDGCVLTHYLNTTGGSKVDHTHIIVREKPGGRKTAHCVPHKLRRR